MAMKLTLEQLRAITMGEAVRFTGWNMIVLQVTQSTFTERPAQ